MRNKIDITTIEREERKKVYSVNMPPSQYAAICAEARARGMGFSEYIRVLCEKVLSNEFARSEVCRENTKKQRVKKVRAVLSLNDNN